MIDLLVIGGGPAGSTLAGLVKKHDPRRRVVLLEKAPGPRHHIGESLLPGLVPVLRELGVLDQIEAAGFPKKIGANYLWGKGDEVWENDFNDANLAEMLRRHGRIPDKIEYAWQVRRSKYDEILLRHAESLGVEVRRGAAAQTVLEEGERLRGVRLVGGEEIRAEVTADCSGQSGFLSRFRKIRRYNPDLKNAAAYAYWRNAEWKYRYTGHPDKTKIFVCAAEHGWFWYIPIDEGIVSVGLVTALESVKRSGVPIEELYVRELRKCREIQPLLEKAERVDDFDGTGRSFFTHQDWSYLNIAASGPGWLAAGDAAVFVDPILSSGVTLAHLAAQRAAYSLLTSWAQPDLSSELWGDYDRFCRESAAQFLALALFWYGQDRRAEGWWLHARELQRAWLPAAMQDQASFITVSAGLTRHYERALTAASLASQEPLRPPDSPFLTSVLGAREVRAGSVPKLLFPWREELTFAPAEGEPRLVPVKRVRFLKHDTQDAVRDALNPRRVVTRWHLDYLAGIDGRRSTLEVSAFAAGRGVPAWWLERQAPGFLEELALQEVLA